MNLPTAVHPPVTPDEPPLLARRLGHAGLIPFVLGALLVWLVWPEVQPDVTLALAGYAAVIVAFLGGIHWGLAMQAGLPGGRPFVWAMVPPLVSWIAIIMPAHAGLVVLGVMLVVCYAVDRRLYVAAGYGHWLMLRFRLSAVAALCCFLGAAGT
jgi:amino acid transporter